MSELVLYGIRLQHLGTVLDMEVDNSVFRDDLVELGETQAGGGVGIGRVQCDSEGRLNSNSVVVQGSLDWSAGQPVPLDLSQAPAFSLFPGQVVALDCSNPTGAKLVATKVYEGVFPPVSPCRLREGAVLTVMSVAGPYTTTDSNSTGSSPAS